MSETRCRYDRDTKAYVDDDGETCDLPRDAHCQARRTCAQHVAWGEITCARCLGRTRTDIRQIVDRSAELMPEAMLAGVDSEAFNLAGPGSDYRVFSARRMIDKTWIQTHVPERRQERAMANLLEDDDEQHPYVMLTRWAAMLAEDYGIEQPVRWTIVNAAALIERELNRVAQDEGQDFPLMAREIRRCRSHIEAVLRDSQQPERGELCPDCKADGLKVRMTREYSHWCDDDACERIHVATDELDLWLCPREPAHTRTMGAYVNYVEERRGA